MEKNLNIPGKYLYYSIKKKHYPPPFPSFFISPLSLSSSLPPYLFPSLPPPFMGKSGGYKEAKSE
jgi:hypothetical protein